MDKPNEIVLFVGFQFVDNLVKWTIGRETLNLAGICFGEQCSRWSKCLRIFNPEYILSVGGRFFCGMHETKPQLREGIISGL